MKIAIIGAGISGLTAAYYLHKEHDIEVFESEDRIGGHTATIDLELNGKSHAIDTGFIVYNDWTYPNFIALLDELGVETQPTSMSFSVSCAQSGIEYGGSNLDTLFAQRRNLLKPKFWGMLRDILRFNKEAVADLQSGGLLAGMTLGDYLDANHYGPEFRDRYLTPMGSAIWSAGMEKVLDFPLIFFVRFFNNHGLLSVKNRPQWRVVKGGSRNYIAPLIAGFRDRVHSGEELASVRRDFRGVRVAFADGREKNFDQVIMACHSDQALALLGDPSHDEREVLGAIPYKANEVILHTDTELLPANKRAWSSWNYWLRDSSQSQAVLTYNMNILQGLECEDTFCVTLNATDAIRPEKILGRFNYSHPEFSLQSIAAANRWQDINGCNNTWFCGAYWGNGFHEDGVVSARRVVDGISAAGVDCAA